MNDSIVKNALKYVIIYIIAFIPGLLLLIFWYFTMTFIHESGHTFFALLTGDPSVTIYSDPPSARNTVPKSDIAALLVSLGGVIFTLIFTIGLLSLIFLFWSYMDWDIQKKKHFGYETFGFHLSLTILGFFLLELINLIPIKDGVTSDMARFFVYFNIDFFLPLPDELFLCIIGVIIISLFVHFMGNAVFCVYLTIQFYLENL